MAKRIRTEVGSIEEIRRTFRQIDQLFLELRRLLAGSAAEIAQAQSLAYTPAVPNDWEDTDPATVVGALDRVAGGHSGVVLISATAPTTPANGQAWLDTLATGSPGTGVLAITTITADTTLTDSQTVVLCDATSGGFTVTLPAASSNSGRRYFVKKVDSSANVVTIDADGDDLIDDALTAALMAQYEAVLLVCDGSEWFIL